jgi:SNF2 family DNA or RNA helicase
VPTSLAAVPVDNSAATNSAAPNSATDKSATNKSALLGERCRDVAAYFVDCGRVVPSLGVDLVRSQARSWWWPLPSASDRELLANLVLSFDVPDTEDGHRIVADALSVAVDTEVRNRLIHGSVVLDRGASPQKAIANVWFKSLCATDPWIPKSVSLPKLKIFAESLTEWVSTGAVALGQTRLALRVCEPVPVDGTDIADGPIDRWKIELLVQDSMETSLVVEIQQFWDGDIPVAPGAMHDVIASIGRMARAAPVLASMLDDAKPTGTELDTVELLTFAAQNIEPLSDIGIEVLLPSWWTRRGRIKLRAKSSNRKSTSQSQSGSGKSILGLQQMVKFSWEAALGDLSLTKAELEALQKSATAKQNLVRVRGQWVTVERTEIEALMKLIGTSGEATAAEMLRTALGLGGIVTPPGLEIQGVAATGWLGTLLDDALHSSAAPISTPPNFDGILRAYQERGVGWLTFLGRLGLGACLADDMGLGKTAQLIATLLADPVPGPTLVLCPVSVLGNWARELARFTPHLTVAIHHGSSRLDDPSLLAVSDVVLSTYSLVARDLDTLNAVDWARIVLDEAQQIKNPGTTQARAVATLRASRRIALTGTPVENRLTELWSIMNVLNPGLLGNLSSFKKTFATPIEKHNNEEAAALLRRVTTPFVLRRMKTDRSIINDLPDKIEMTEHCPLTKEQATLYQAVVDELIEASENNEGIARKGLVLSGISKLKQVCNHPAHFLGDGSALSGRSGKLERIEELIEEILSAQEKVLCFTQYAEWGELLVPYLAQRFATDPLWLHGGVTRKKRDAMVEQFGDVNGPPVFLLSLKAGGTGLNLTAASHVIHLDRWWNPAVEDQATDRAYRIGQKRSVLVHKLVSAGTIEEKIDEMIASKRKLAGSIVGSSENWITELSTEDLRSVISLRTDARGA